MLNQHSTEDNHCQHWPCFSVDDKERINHVLYVSNARFLNSSFYFFFFVFFLFSFFLVGQAGLP